MTIPKVDSSDPRGTAGLQLQIDLRMFEQTPIHIVERYLESFSSDGKLTFPVAQHILEAVAVRFRDFFEAKPNSSSLDKAFGGQTARQRQARHAADRQHDVAFRVIVERQRIRELRKGGRDRTGTPTDLAFENVAEQLDTSVDNVRRIYNAKGTKSGTAG